MSIDIEESSKKFLDRAIKKHESRGQVTYSTGFYDLDQVLDGFPKSQLTLLAGRHSMGKTSFALGIAANSAKSGRKVLFISCEMNEEILMNRIITAEAEIELKKINQGVLAEKDWNRISETLNNEDFIKIKDNLIIEPSFTEKFEKLAEIINTFSNSNPDGMVIIDYFQQLNRQGLAQDRYVELADIASSIKRLAVENDIHIILLSQISRKVEERTDKRPLISDLSECDALSQHSDNIIFIHREEYWNKEDCHIRGIATIIIDKIKNSNPTELELLFQANIMKFKQPIRTAAF